MRLVRLAEDREVASFADRARRAFAENDKMQSFADGNEIKSDSLLALRWNDYTVCVLRVETEPLLFDTAALITARQGALLMDDPPEEPF